MNRRGFLAAGLASLGAACGVPQVKSEPGSPTRVSLADVRDEVCRRLRMSPARFEVFLEHALQQGPSAESWQLSIETDMREDLRSGRGLARRPVYIRGVPHTLIAVGSLPSVPRSAS